MSEQLKTPPVDGPRSSNPATGKQNGRGPRLGRLLLIAWAVTYLLALPAYIITVRALGPGVRLQPWINVPAYLFLGASTAVILISLPLLIGRATTLLIPHRGRLLRICLTLTQIVVTTAVTLWVMLAALFTADQNIPGKIITPDGETYALYSNGYHETCYRYDGAYLLRERYECPEVKPPQPPPPKQTNQGDKPGAHLPAPAVETPKPKPGICQTRPHECYYSTVNRRPMPREAAQKEVEALAGEIQPVKGSSYGWVEVGAALGARQVYVVAQTQPKNQAVTQDGATPSRWMFVTEVPSTGGVGEARLENGKLRFENSRETLTYNLATRTWATSPKPR